MNEKAAIWIFGSLLAAVAIAMVIRFAALAWRYRDVLRKFNAKSRQVQPIDDIVKKRAEQWRTDVQRFRRVGVAIWLICVAAGLAWVVANLVLMRK